MATRKQATKPAPKPARKPLPTTTKPSSLDLVRNPNFDSAMAQMNYENLMAGQRAQLAAQQGQYTKGRLMGAPTNQPIQSRVPMGFSTYDEAGIPEDQRKILDDEMAKMQLDIAARDVEQQNMKKAGAFTIGGTPDKPIYGSMAGPVYADGTFVDATNQQAQNYQNFLQQGMQNSNTLNQGGMANFAKMQAGMQAPQQTNTTTKPKMPLGGMGMQQPRQAPAPRKFSTVRNTPARFG
jgi:hypothetical protein